MPAPTTLQSLAARKEALLPPGTNAYRLADGTPWRGVYIDSLAGRYLVSLRDVELPPALRAELLADGRDVYIKHLSKGDKSAPVPLLPPTQPQRFIVQECGVRYMLDMQAGYSQGLFIDQRNNRAELRRLSRPGDTVLNLFAYTGAFSVCAALGGATTTTLDLAAPCLDWCRENMMLNSISPADHFFCKGDALRWLSTFRRQGRRFTGIVLDPPTFSRADKGRIWRVESHYGELVARAAACLMPGGWILCTTNCRKITPAAFRAQVTAAAPAGASITSAPMPPDFDGDPYLKTLRIHT